MIDGIATGKTTPATLELAPGKHKVTYDIDGEKFTFSVVIEAGKTELMTKDLRP